MTCSTVYFLTGNYLQMNSGLPSLIDAIFGKQDLASVSLDEMYEVINEFPSFNAGHFLLAKKLKQHNDAAYNKESMRTALYFNNPFWLQTLLDEGKTIRQEERTLPVKAEVEEEHPYQTYTNEPTAPAKDELDDEEEEIIDEKIASEPVHNDPEFNYQEPGPDTISSFDELMSK